MESDAILYSQPQVCHRMEWNGMKKNIKLKPTVDSLALELTNNSNSKQKFFSGTKNL